MYSVLCTFYRNHLRSWYALGTAVVVGILVLVLALFPNGATRNAFAAGVFTASSTDADGNTQLSSNTVNDTFTYDTGTDSSAATQRSLGVDPNWQNGVTRRSYALKFDGTDDYVNVPDSTSLRIGSGDFTLAAWVKTTTASGLHVLLMKGNPLCDTCNPGYSLHQSNTTYTMSINPTNSAGDVINLSANSAVIANQWQYVVGTRTGNTLSIYVDGQLKSSTTVSPFSITWAAYPLSLSFASYPMLGYLDDVRIYNRSLSSSEIQQLYGRQVVSSSGLAGQWQFDDGSGTSALDSSPYGTTGTLMNGSSNSPAADGTTNGPIWVSGSNAVMDGFKGCAPEDAACTPTSGQTGAGNLTLTADSSTASTNGYEVRTANSPGLQFNNAGTTNADGDWVSYAGSNHTTDIRTGSMTWSFWGKTTQATRGNWYRRDDGVAKSGVVIYFSGNRLLADFAQAGGTGFTVDSAISGINNGKWHLFTVVLDRAAQRALTYVDGTAGGTADASLLAGLDLQASTYFQLGDLGSSHNVQGTMDDVRVYKRALSASEISGLYNGSAVSNQSLAAWWKLNEGSGTSVQDASGNGNTGTLENSQSNSPAADGTTVGPLWTEGISKGSNSPNWALAGYQYRQQLQITNPNGSTLLPTGYAVNSPVSRAAALTANQTRADGTDWRIVHQPTDPVRGLQLSGTNNTLVTVPNSSNLSFDTGQNFSVSLWLKLPVNQTNTSQTQNSILEKWSGSGAYPYALRYYNQTSGLNPGKILFVRFNNPNVSSIVSSKTLNDNQWHLITATKNGTTLSLYVDNALQGTTTDTTTGTTNTAPVTLGGRSGTPGLSGSLDDVRIYNVGLSKSQVSALYNGGSGTPQTVTSGLVGWWRLDESSGQIVADSSGNGNHGTLGATSAAASDDPTWVSDGVVSTTYEVPRTIPKGAALSFNGTSTGVSVANSSQVQAIGSQGSMTGWVWRNTTTGVTQTVFDLAGTGVHGATLFASATGGCGSGSQSKIVFQYGTGSTAKSLCTAAVSNAAWHQVTATWNAQGVWLYLDGQLASSNTTNPASISVPATSYLGSLIGGTVDFLNGKLDDFRLYSYPLSLAEVKTLYNSGQGQAAASANGLVAGWRMDEASGSSLADFTGNGSTGTISNGTWAPNQGAVDSSTETYFQTIAPIAASGTNSDFYAYYGNATEKGTALASPVTSKTDLLFNAATTSVTVGNGSSINNLGQVSISAWIMPNGYGGGGYGRIFDKAQRYLYLTNTGQITFQQGFSSAGGQWSTPASSISLHAWSQVVLTYDSSSSANDPKIYINGQVQTLTKDYTPSGTASADAASPAYIGNNAAGNRGFDGKIDDTREYSRILSDQEAADLYSNTAPVSSTGLVGWWKLDSGSGTSAADSAGTNTATLTNFTFDATNGWAVNPNLWQAASAPTVTALTAEVDSPLYLQYRTVSGPTSYGAWSVLQPMGPGPVVLGATGVKVRFNQTGSYSRYDTFHIASWAVEAFSSIRGKRRSFPDKAYIISTGNNGTGGVSIIDAGTNKLWMSFPDEASGESTFLGSNSAKTTLMRDGRLYVGTAWNVSGQPRIANFADEMNLFTLPNGSSRIRFFNGVLAQRATAAGFTNVISSTSCPAYLYSLSLQTLGGKLYLAGAGSTSGYAKLCVFSDIAQISPVNPSPTIRQYSRTNPQDGYKKVVLTSAGTLYAANVTQGGLDRWDNVQNDSADRIGSVDRSYTTSSTPALRNGTVNSLSVAEGASVADAGKNEVAVGTGDGLAVIDEHGTQVSSQVRYAVRAGTKAGGKTWDGSTYGNALDFNGTSQYANLGNPAAANFGTGSFTYSLWVNPTSSVGAYDMPIWKGGSSAGNAGFELELGSGAWTANIADGTTIKQAAITGSPYNNQWSLLTVVVDRSTNRMNTYRNGLLCNSLDISGLGSVTGSSSLTFGNEPGDPYWYNGKLDDVRLYNAALTPAQVAQLYANPAGVPTTNLVGYWNFNELDGQSQNLFDSSGQNNTGTLGANASVASDDPMRVAPALSGSSDAVSAVADQRTSQIGRDLSFSGSQYVNLGNASSYSFSGTSPFSITGWFNATATSSLRTIVSKYNNGVGGDYFVGVYNGKFEFEREGPAPLTLDGNTTIQTGRWYSFAAVYDGTNKYVYVNGVSDAVPVAQGTATTSSQNLAIGTAFGSGSMTFPFSGQVDDIRIYNRALSASEAASLYAGGVGVKGQALTSGLVGWWNLDEASGQTVADVSGNGHNGTLGADASVNTDDPSRTLGSPVGSRGFLWAGTSVTGAVTGFSLATMSPVKSYTSSTSSLPSNDIVSLAATSSGLSLIGTNGGGAWAPGADGILSDTNSFLALAGSSTEAQAKVKGGTVRIKGGTVRVP